ncbi:hypothetical protein U0070_022305 [Myodes glareolus]|uniref:Uncharacterized protein n=1 Tax=Myodes glareolus TaxID=447135 RepID=A0AAW0IBF1_MYOGA
MSASVRVGNDEEFKEAKVGLECRLLENVKQQTLSALRVHITHCGHLSTVAPSPGVQYPPVCLQQPVSAQLKSPVLKKLKSILVNARAVFALQFHRVTRSGPDWSLPSLSNLSCSLYEEKGRDVNRCVVDCTSPPALSSPVGWTLA